MKQNKDKTRSRQAASVNSPGEVGPGGKAVPAISEAVFNNPNDDVKSGRWEYFRLSILADSAFLLLVCLVKAHSTGHSIIYEPYRYFSNHSIRMNTYHYY